MAYMEDIESKVLDSMREQDIPLDTATFLALFHIGVVQLVARKFTHDELVHLINEFTSERR